MSVPAKHAAQIFPTVRAQRWLDREGGQPRKYEGGLFKNISTTAERQWTPNELRRGRRESLIGHFNTAHKQLNWKPTKWGSDAGNPREADLERLNLRWDYLSTLMLCENWLDREGKYGRYSGKSLRLVQICSPRCHRASMSLHPPINSELFGMVPRQPRCKYS